MNGSRCPVYSRWPELGQNSDRTITAGGIGHGS